MTNPKASFTHELWTIAGKSLQGPEEAPSHVQQTVRECSHTMETVWVSQEESSSDARGLDDRTDIAE